MAELSQSTHCFMEKLTSNSLRLTTIWVILVTAMEIWVNPLNTIGIILLITQTGLPVKDRGYVTQLSLLSSTFLTLLFSVYTDICITVTSGPQPTGGACQPATGPCPVSKSFEVQDNTTAFLLSCIDFFIFLFPASFAPSNIPFKGGCIT
jgi:hypothetical protein